MALLLKNDKTLSEYTLKILSKCNECGYLIGIATSRGERLCGMDCEIAVDTLGAHYWNYKTDPKEQDKSWGDSIYTDFTDFEYEALKICVEIHHPSLARKLCERFSGLDSQHFSDGDWYKFTESGIIREKAIVAVCEACHADDITLLMFHLRRCRQSP